MPNIDNSIYLDASKDVKALLESYPKEKVLDAVLYIVDEVAIEKLKEINKLLSMEYSQHDAVASVGIKKKRGKPFVEEYSLPTIVKVINFEQPANSYQTFIAESWKQINDPKKVKESLEVEFIKHKNKIKKFTQQKLKEKGVSEDIKNDIMRNIDKEIREAEKEYQYIVENFDALDVRISSYFERTKYAALRWYVMKKKQPDVNLRKQVPNVLWYRELSEDEKIRIDNELVHYLSKAKRAYGDVFYKEKEE